MISLFEKMLARWLALDPESDFRMQQLDGRVVTLRLKGVSLTCQLVFDAGQVSIKMGDALPADLVIEGTPLRLLQLQFSKERQSFFSDDVKVTGSMTLAAEVMALFDQLEPDWEEWLAQKVGDIPAHHAARFVSHIRRSAREIGRRLGDNFSEYLQEESKLCVPSEAIADFCADVDDLRLSVDRLDARFKQLVHLIRSRDSV